MPICPHVQLTWYPGEWPSEASPLPLLGAGHWLDDAAPFNGGIEQLVQRADFVRADAPGLWGRGNRTMPLEWTEVRKIADAGEAAATALAICESLPKETGWLQIWIPSVEQEWLVDPVVIRGVRWTHSPVLGELRLTWSLECGPVTRLATDSEADALVTETGWEWELEDESGYVALEV